MKPRITLVTLGVDDLERAVAFYRDDLGFDTKGILGTEFENGAVAFFNLQPGLTLALWPRTSLAADSGLPLQAPGRNGAVSRAQCRLAGRGRCHHASGRAGRRDDRQARAAHVLWRLRAISRIPTVTFGKSRSIQGSTPSAERLHAQWTPRRGYGSIPGTHHQPVACDSAHRLPWPPRRCRWPAADNVPVRRRAVRR